MNKIYCFGTLPESRSTDAEGMWASGSSFFSCKFLFPEAPTSLGLPECGFPLS